MAKIAAPKGVSEYFPERSKHFEYVRETLIRSAKVAGYELIELPVFEDTELFRRGVGESTDVVSKEMFSFEDRGGRPITLRPEGTAGVMRSVIENNLDRGRLPVKVYYSGQFFRAERPQLGRYRQFYQVGIEAIGVADPQLDVEVIAVADRAFKKLGLKRYRLEITSLGDSASRQNYLKDLRTYIDGITLDEVTRGRAAINPLRLFDDKRPEIREQLVNAPVLLDYLTPESTRDFAAVQSSLTKLGIHFVVNKRMVRGLDYYTDTAFEFVHEDLGVDRILLACEAEQIPLPEELSLDLYIVPLGTGEQALALAEELRSAQIRVDLAFGDRALKGAMKSADKSGAKFSLVLGADELAVGVVKLKDMKSGESDSVTLGSLANELNARISSYGERS